ncbi:MAG: alpha/beta hydrolase [Hyphomicrobiales bacterium]|nr:alpha/beta hydrolase [Hyphomicrobiales bacterium]
MTDSMMDDIAADYDRSLRHSVSLEDGRKYWPELFFARPGGFRPLTLDLHIPSGGSSFPAVVYIHGGAWMMGHPKVDNPILNAMDIVGNLNAAGFAVARISYRMSAEALFPAQLQDCKAAVRYLRKHCKSLHIDPERFAAMGESAGGHLACLLGLTGDRPDLEGALGETEPGSNVQAVVDWYGPDRLSDNG